MKMKFFAITSKKIIDKLLNKRFLTITLPTRLRGDSILDSHKNRDNAATQ